MKVYTVYLDGDQGWTSTDINGFYSEVINLKECNPNENIFSEEVYNNDLSKLNIGDSFIIFVGDSELEVKCEEMSEEEYNNLGEFSGW